MYSESCQISKMEPYAKIVNGFQLLTIFAESSILDNELGSEYACRSERYHLHCTKNKEILNGKFNFLCSATHVQALLKRMGVVFFLPSSSRQSHA